MPVELKVKVNSQPIRGITNCSAAAQALQASRKVQTVEFDAANTSLADKDAADLAQSLRRRAHLTSIALVLQRKQVGDTGADALAQTFASCSKLVSVELDLWGSAVGNDGAEAVGKGLAKCRSLAMLALCLNSTQVGDSGAVGLAKGLGCCAQLTSLALKLQMTTVGDEFAKALGNELAKCPRLEKATLQLSYTRIGDRGSVSLGSGLAQCPALNRFELFLEGVDCKIVGTLAFLDKLKKQQRLQSVDLHFPQGTIQKKNQAWKYSGDDKAIRDAVSRMLREEVQPLEEAQCMQEEAKTREEESIREAESQPLEEQRKPEVEAPPEAHRRPRAESQPLEEQRKPEVEAPPEAHRRPRAESQPLEEQRKPEVEAPPQPQAESQPLKKRPKPKVEAPLEPGWRRLVRRFCCGQDERRASANQKMHVIPATYCGITGQQLNELAEEVASKFTGAKENPSVYVVVDEIIKPKCKSDAVSYAVLKNAEGLDCSTFVTHAWFEPFLEFVGALMEYFGAGFYRRVFWICFTANPQTWADSELNTWLGPSPWRSAFAEAIKHCQEFVVVRNRNGNIYTRLWCVAEVVYVIAYTNTDVTVRNLSSTISSPDLFCADYW